MRPLFSLKVRPRPLARRAMAACIGDIVQPLLDVLSHGRFAGEALAIQAVLLDVLHAGFHLALALRVVTLTGVDPVASGGGVLMETLVQGQLAIALVD